MANRAAEWRRNRQIVSKKSTKPKGRQTTPKDKPKKKKETTPSRGEERRESVRQAREKTRSTSSANKGSGSFSNTKKSESKPTTSRPQTRSGAITTVSKAGPMGGNKTATKKERPKTTVNGKAIGPVTKAGVMGHSSSGKTKPNKPFSNTTKSDKSGAVERRGVGKAGVMKNDKRSKKAEKELADWKAQQRAKQGKKTNALGVEAKTHTGTWGNPVGKAVVDVASQVTTRTRTNVGAINEAKKQAKKDQKKFEKDYNYKLSDQEKKEWRQDYYDQTIKALSSKKSKKEIDKAAKELAKASGVKGGSYKAQDLTNEDYLKIQNATRVDHETGRKMLGDKLAKKVGSNTAYNATKNTASKVTTGIMQGMSYGDVVHGGPGIYGKEEKQAIKELQESGAYNIGYGAGMLGGFAISGVGGAGKAIAQTAGKGAAKGLAKATTKSAGKKFAQNRLGELAAETPLNALDAVKMSRDENGNINKKEALKWMGINTLLTGGMGAAIEGAGMKFTKKNARKLISLQAKANNGTITDAEKETLQKLYKSLDSARKDVQAAKSNTAERGYLKAKELKGEADDIRFAQEVDKIITGESKGDRPIRVGDTPESLLDQGAKDLQMTMKPGTVRKMAYPQGYEDALKGLSKRESKGHNLGVGAVKTTRKDLSDPLYIFESKTQDNSFVVIIKKQDTNGNPIMEAVHLDKDGRVGPANEVASGYSTTEEFIKRETDEGRLLVDNTKKGSVNGLQGNGLRLPERDDPLDPMIRLQQENVPVKDIEKSGTQKGKPQNVGYHAAETGPRDERFRELEALEKEWNELNQKKLTPELEARGDEIIARMDELSKDLGGERITKENADEALKAIEAQRASDETLVKNNEDVIKNSDDELAGIERPTPDPGETPKGLKPNKRVSRPTKNSVEEVLRGSDENTKFTKAEKKEIDDKVERASNMIANSDRAGARKEAEELVEKYYHFDTEEKLPNENYAKEKKNLAEAKAYIASQPWTMPAQAARTLDEFYEAIGFPKSASRKLPIRRYGHVDSATGLKGVSGKMVNRGGKRPVGIDERWDEMSELYPDLFPKSVTDSVERFKIMADVASRDPKDIPKDYTRPFDEAEIADMKRMAVDEILEMAEKNAAAYRGIDESTPLKSIDGMGIDQLEKEIRREKIHLENAKKKHGEDALRVKEIENWLSDANKSLDEIRGETKTVEKTPEQKAAEKAETKGMKPKGIENLENSKDAKIKELPEEKIERNLKETKEELDNIVKTYGEDSPRAKEAKEKIEDLEGRLEDAKHEKETGQKTNNTGDAPPPLLSAEFTIDEPRTRLGKAWKSFYRVSVDSFADIEKAAKKIGGKQGQALLSQVNAVRNSKNISASWITDRRSNWNRETVGESLDKIFKRAGKGQQRQDFIDYCYHKHNLERLDVDKPISGMPREAEESLAAIKELEAKYGDKIKRFQEDIVKYADDLLQYKVDAGIVSKAEADALRKYKNYIPTFTNKDFKGTINEDLSQGISVDRGLRRAVGGNEEDELVDLYQQLAQSTRSTMKHTEMNEMIRMLGDLQGIKYSEIDKGVSPDQMLENSLFTESSNGKFFATYYDADGAHTISIPEDMFKGIREWTGEEKAILVNNGLVRGFGVPGRMFKNLVTGWNVIFGVRNGVRDLATALTYTKDLKGFAKAYPKAVKTVLTRKGPYWDAYIAAGGKYSSLAKSGGADGFMDALDSFKGSPLTWAKEVNDTIETMPRMMEFISTIDKAGGINGAGREVINRAMRNANDVTLNFGRSGIAGRMMNSGFVPYLNPSIQGLDKLFRVFTEAKQEKNFRGLIGLGMKMSTFAIAPAVFNEWMLKDNEDYQQLNTRDKDSNYFIPLGDGKFIKIPKARELVVVAEPAQYFFRHAQFGDSGGWKQMFQSAIDNIGVVNPLTDNLVSPLYRVATNKTWFGGNIESAYEVDNLLPQDRYDEGTTLLAIDLAQKNPAKALGLSPKKIDNLIDSYTGVIGDFFIPMNSKASKGNPFVNKFITDSVFSNKLSTEAWDAYETYKQQSNSTTLDPKKAQKAKYKMQDLYNGYLGDTVTLNNAITDIQNNNKLSKAEKHELVRQLKKSQNEIYRSSKDGSTPTLDGKAVDPLTAIYNLYSSRKDTKGKAVGLAFKYAHKNYQESYEKYKESEEYAKMSGTDKTKSRVKYLKYVTTIRDTRGKIGEEKDNFIDYKTVAVVGQMKKASESMMDSFGKGSQGLYKYLKENAKTYKDYKYDLRHFIETEKINVDSSRKIGLDYRSQMQNHDIAMTQAHEKRDDGSYFIGDKKPEYQKPRKDPARYLVKKDAKQWSTQRIHDFADKHGYSYESDYDEVYKQAKKTYPDRTEKEWAAVAQVITGKGDNDFGDQTIKGDSGIFGAVKDEGGSGGGRGRRRGRRGRRGRGGGGGSSGGGGGEVPKTASGAIKASISKLKVTDPFSNRASNLVSASNLNDAYRKKAKKLREQARKRK